MRSAATILILALLLPQALLAAKKDKPDETARFWETEAVHAIHLRVTAQQWQLMQPIRKGSLSRISASAMQPPSTRPSTQPVLMPRPTTSAAPHGEGDRLEPNFFGMEFAYVKAAFECDGVAVKDIGLRLRGNSSFGWNSSGLKRPFKVDFNRFDEKQKFEGMSSFYLNNNAYDPSLMREALSYETFRKLNVPAPRTSYAVVFLTIDGKCERECLGLYTLIETMDTKPFLKAHFGSAKGMLMKPWSIRGLPYLGEQWEKYERYYVPRSEPTPEGARRTIDFIKLVNYADDETFRRQIDQYLDVDEFLRLLAGDVLLANTDNFLYTGHNWYLYLNPKDNRFALMPWDMNLSFANYTSTGSPDQLVHLSLMHPHAGEMKLIDRLLAMPRYAEDYRGHIKRATDTFFSPQAMSARVDALQAVIARADAAADAAWKARYAQLMPAAATQPSKIPPRPLAKLTGWQGGAAIDIKDFMTQRIASINAQLAGGSDGYTLGSRRYPQPPPGGLRAHSIYGYLPILAFAAVRSYDTDHDGNLTRAECLAAVRSYFAQADASRRGAIDTATLSQALGRSLKQISSQRRGGNNQTPPRTADPDAWTRAVFMAVDAEKTGKITLDQAMSSALKAITLADKDKSGKLDVDELLALLDNLAAAAPPPRPPEPPRRSPEQKRPAESPRQTVIPVRTAATQRIR
jgi:spore coat protein H